MATQSPDHQPSLHLHTQPCTISSQLHLNASSGDNPVAGSAQPLRAIQKRASTSLPRWALGPSCLAQVTLDSRQGRAPMIRFPYHPVLSDMLLIYRFFARSDVRRARRGTTVLKGTSRHGRRIVEGFGHAVILSYRYKFVNVVPVK